MRIAIVFAVVSLLVAAGPVSAADQPPGILHSTLLNGVKLDADSHAFSIDKLTMAFLPAPKTQTGSIYKYNPDDGDSLQATVTDATGKVVLRLGFYANAQQAPFWIAGSYTFLENHTGNQPSGSRVKLAPGTYVLDFFVQDKAFYRFPFEITEIASTDPFQPAAYRFLEGDWNDWGYLYYPKANPEMNLYWKVWLRHKATESSKSVKPTMEVFRGDERVAVGNENYSFTLRPEWTRVEFQLNMPPDAPAEAGRYLKAKHILAVDGDYRLVVSIDGEPYGTWPFQVKDGKFAAVERTLRGTAEPLTFVEGGQDAFWYGK